MRHISARSLAIAAAVVLGTLTMTACTTTSPEAQTAPDINSSTLNTRVNAALERLYQTAPGSKAMVQQAKGVLVFPSVVGGSFIIGAEHGRGVLRVGGKNVGEYTTTAASVGWQAGGQSKAVIYLFNTQEALNKFLASDGWSAGADANVALGTIGANGSVDTKTASAPVSGYVLNNAGLEAGVSLSGSKITKVTK